MNKMERCSYFIPEKALFGSFPTQEDVNFLEEQGVRYFIDLTCDEEQKIVPYKTRYTYIKYSIRDRHVPENWQTFAKLIVTICDIIKNLKSGEKIYVNCKGGHGRSGVVVACILCNYFGMSPTEALIHTTRYHSNRPKMNEKWRKIGSPQGIKQKEFVRAFFRPLKFGHDKIGFGNFSHHPVFVPELGYTFPNAQLAFQAFKGPENKEYIEKLIEGHFCPEKIKKHVQNWDENKIEYMTKVLDLKFTQHSALKQQLLDTGLRPLVKISIDSFWGDSGKNMHGKILVKLRLKYIRESQA
jgi:predicted NAD-dependent protein-ADP-ribosyltransferase YbiA (DUF1768 family)